MQSNISRSIAKSLLDVGAIQFNLKELFTWTSGIKSPIYCDNRVINSIVATRDEVVNGFIQIIRERFLADIDIIAGVATGGMTYGVLVADRLKLPFIYVRGEKKGHGLKRAVEGYFRPGNRIVLIEDLISTGKSSLKAVEFLREEGLELLALLSINTYDFKETHQLFRDHKVSAASLCGLDTVLDVAGVEGRLRPEDVKAIQEFILSPKTWGPNASSTTPAAH